MSGCIGLFSKHTLDFKANGRIKCDKCKCTWDLDGRELIPYGYKSYKEWYDYCHQNHLTPASAPESHYSGKNPLPLRDVAVTLAEEVIKRKYPLFKLGKNKVSAQDLTQIEAIRHQAAKDPAGFIRSVQGR